jgi:hypothetical protein
MALRFKLGIEMSANWLEAWVSGGDIVFLHRYKDLQKSAAFEFTRFWSDRVI